MALFYAIQHTDPQVVSRYNDFMVYLLLIAYIYLVIGVFFYANKRPSYSHVKHTISELGENGSDYERPVAYQVFMPAGLGLLLLTALTYTDHWPVALLTGAMGFGYFLSAFFPCDSGTPMYGSWKNSVHNLVGGVAYVTMVYQLKELIDQQAGWHAELAFILLSVFLLNFIIGWPRKVVGLTQRLAESGVFLCVFWLLFENGSVI